MTPCEHDFVDITTASEEQAGLRREICIAGCRAERTDPPTH
jgi:hypothetical protein